MTTPPGVPAERTALAWQRTGLGVMAVAGLMGHRAVASERPVLLAVAGLTALLSLAVLGGFTPVRYRRVRRAVAAGEPVAAPRSVAGATLVVVATALAALVAVVMPR